MKEGNEFPSAQDAWNEQQKTINDLQAKLVIAGDTLKRARATISELKNFTEENLTMMYQLEVENAKLKEE